MQQVAKIIIANFLPVQIVTDLQEAFIKYEVAQTLLLKNMHMRTPCTHSRDH
jgi:hypothetical protein